MTNRNQTEAKVLPILKWTAIFFALAILAQVFIAGMSLFVDSADWVAHKNFARVFIVFPVITILLSFITRLPISYRLKGIQQLVMVVLMFVTANLSSKIGILGALHPVIALGMFWSATSLAKQAATSRAKGEAK
ncbi:DUF6220 domain-containing protein [Paenibacillus sp. OV219]|uniref:DUF6220 domain-containing protein n=1 Tax=Paenibacillus sp. OV219 TaxID=1884377 RepID=UPI0008CCEA64|nr:DUF6220 domain-containing protein [Paenibacillus sp. OV219]SEM62413.1 hypothetical protein SAMN05518847_101338 [Paenibacillus sp. OV219]